MSELLDRAKRDLQRAEALEYHDENGYEQWVQAYAEPLMAEVERLEKENEYLEESIKEDILSS